MKETRRTFIKSTFAVATAGLPDSLGSGKTDQPPSPWYRRTVRWGQTNITEKDPIRYDIKWWRQYWKKTQVQGVIINAGGIVAYYPSRYPLHRRAQFLGDRDLFGELGDAAHQDGLAVLARMDSNRADEAFYRAHPDWFAQNVNGQPYRAADKYVACINSPYYEQYLPDILREIIERSHPEGFTDNSWAGLDRDNICFCEHCAQRFRAHCGEPIPRKAEWNDPVFRQWIQWNYKRRLEIWDLNNRTTQTAGGPDCIWIGMNSGSISEESRTFRDLREIGKRAQILLLDHQARNDATGFQQNGDTGKRVHGLLGWEKLMPESMAMYQAGRHPFRLSSKPTAEARMWMIEGIAGGIQPWWHHVGAYHEDRRMYRTAEPLLRWHKANEEVLINRQPVATVGIGWSQRNTDFYGRDAPEDLVDLPYDGMMQALIRARIPYLPVHLDHLDKDGATLTLLILPNVAAMSGEQVSSVRRFVERGGSLIATGVTSLYDEWGEPRKDFALADLFLSHIHGSRLGTADSPERQWAAGSFHTYLRLAPELRAEVDGPKAGDEPVPRGERHQVLEGFEETDILPFGGMIETIQTDPGSIVPMTFIPPFPVYPPETAWMREPKTELPGLILSSHTKGGHIAYMPADIDRRFARDNLPDHGNLLANLVRWAAQDKIPLKVDGRGLIDCHIYLQPGRVILHLVNLTSAGTWRAPVDELIPIGPLQVKIRLPDGVRGNRAQFLVSKTTASLIVDHGWGAFQVQSILDHEVALIS